MPRPKKKPPTEEVEKLKSEYKKKCESSEAKPFTEFVINKLTEAFVRIKELEDEIYKE